MIYINHANYEYSVHMKNKLNSLIINIMIIDLNHVNINYCHLNTRRSIITEKYKSWIPKI